MIMDTKIENNNNNNTSFDINMENHSLAANRVLGKRSGTEMSERESATSFKVRKEFPRSQSMFSPKSVPNSPSKRSSLQRSMSDVIVAVERSCEDRSLIGDFSKKYALPLIKGKHDDLKTISADVLASVLNGEYAELIESCTIVDCRYPYEYNAGHIKGAKNIYFREAINGEFFPDIRLLAPNQESIKRRILVFHCEFSSERGPSLYRYLRKQDRTSNNYPSLHYPEIYILDGGYKAFYKKYKEHCEPPEYLPMHSKDHANDLRHFRAKVKSLNSDVKH